MRRLDALTEFMALYKVNRDLNRAIATHSIEGRAAFIAIASGQYLLPRGRLGDRSLITKIRMPTSKLKPIFHRDAKLFALGTFAPQTQIFRVT